MEFAYVEGEKDPLVVYKPFIYATVYDCHVCYAVEKKGKIELYNTENRKEIRYGISKKM